MDLFSKEEAKLMDALLVHAISGVTISNYEIERYNINITDGDYIQHLIDLIVDYSNKHNDIVNVFDRGTKYQSFESNFKTIRFNSEGGFESNLKSLSLKKPKETNSLAINENKIFISHSSKDSVLVNKFIDGVLILGMGLLKKNIFCTSKYGTDIKTGNDFKKVIKEELEGCIAVVQIITKNYKESGVCMNEMGAAWVLCDIVIPIVAQPFDYDVGFINHSTVQLKLNSSKDLIKMYNDFNKNIFKSHVDINELNRHISEFINWINTFENEISKEDLNKNKIEKFTKTEVDQNSFIDKNSETEISYANLNSIKIDSDDLSKIFGRTTIWDFYLNDKKIESIMYDSQLKTMFTNTKGRIVITNIRISKENGIILFDKNTSKFSNLTSTLIKTDKNTIDGVEGINKAKYIRTNKLIF